LTSRSGRTATSTAGGSTIRHAGMSNNGFDQVGNFRLNAAVTSIAAQHVVHAEVHHENQAAQWSIGGIDCHSPPLPPAVCDVTDGRRATSVQSQRSPTDSLHSSGSNGSRGGERTGSSPVWETQQQGQRMTRQAPNVAAGSAVESRGRGGRQMTTISSRDRSAVRQVPSPSNKSQDELEKMRILARHVKVCTFYSTMIFDPT
jgi:hypothetical protein